jgi:hypothetical protein
LCFAEDAVLVVQEEKGNLLQHPLLSKTDTVEVLQSEL